ncbi:C2 calcium-dependent membrane targeting [Thalictrum thalictroides]|uniref:C2 calcium-dependent membrane targeting n=1 Tax=Thalictrum thalictroides TaxID=46969 RepID=A0A7J6VL80_THATH|nr:C2 calcium-dependent membrane targeting [Thalictrum thalictroides]
MPQDPPNNNDDNEAVLKLKIVNGEDLKDIRFLGKTKSFILAWIDPSFKQSTKTLTTSTKNPTWNYDLSFPLSLQTLQNPNSILTIQIISPSSPIHHKRVIGTTILSITDIQFDEKVFTLQLWRPSGRAHGLIRVSVRVVIDLGFYTTVGCVTGIPVQMNVDESQPLIVDQIESSRYHHHCHQPVVPSAPLVEDEWMMDLAVENDLVESVSSGSVETNTVELLLRSDGGIDQMDNAVNDCDSASKSSVASDGSNVLRSILVGFLGGAVAVATVLVGTSNG